MAKPKPTMKRFVLIIHQAEPTFFDEKKWSQLVTHNANNVVTQVNDPYTIIHALESYPLFRIEIHTAPSEEELCQRFVRTGHFFDREKLADYLCAISPNPSKQYKNLTIPPMIAAIIKDIHQNQIIDVFKNALQYQNKINIKSEFKLDKDFLTPVICKALWKYHNDPRILRTNPQNQHGQNDALAHNCGTPTNSLTYAQIFPLPLATHNNPPAHKKRKTIAPTSQNMLRVAGFQGRMIPLPPSNPLQPQQGASDPTNSPPLPPPHDPTKNPSPSHSRYAACCGSEAPATGSILSISSTTKTQTLPKPEPKPEPKAEPNTITIPPTKKRKFK